MLARARRRLPHQPERTRAPHPPAVRDRRHSRISIADRTRRRPPEAATSPVSSRPDTSALTRQSLHPTAHQNARRMPPMCTQATARHRTERMPGCVDRELQRRKKSQWLYNEVDLVRQVVASHCIATRTSRAERTLERKNRRQTLGYRLSNNRATTRHG